MYLAKLRALGGSVVLALPPHMLRSADLGVNDTVSILWQNGQFVIQPHPKPKPKYHLSDLVAQCDFTAPYTTEETAWLTDRPQGREEI
jgi:antitoxin ChpS